MAEFLLRYADPRGQMHEQVSEAPTEREARDRLARQGYLVYSVRAKDFGARLGSMAGRKRTVNLEKFLIFNQQFVTLIRAGLPILKGLDLLADRLTDEKMGRHIQAVRNEVRTGTTLSDAFANQRVFPAIYVTSVLAGEKSGSLVEVLERYIHYQRLTLSLRKKLLVSLLYPSVLVVLVVCLIVFLVTYVVPNFASLYNAMDARLPMATTILIAVGTTARAYVLVGFSVFAIAAVAAYFWSRRDEFAREAGSREDAAAAARRGMDEVSGGATLARARDAFDGRHSAGSGAGDDGALAGQPAFEEGAG